MGKAKQAAKTEMEKLKIQELTCRELVKQAAKMQVLFLLDLRSSCSLKLSF